MSISIDHFEEEIHLLIAERGKEYFDAHQVTQLEETDNGWSAVIKGSESYDVLLEGHDVITQWHCSCPFEHGPVCKHIAAVFYAVRERIQVNRANATGELDRWIDGAPTDVLRRLLKTEIRINESTKASVYSAMKSKINADADEN